MPATRLEPSHAERPSSRALAPFALITGDFVKTGGMDRANHALAAHLAARGHAVHLVGYRADDDLLAMPNVRLHRVPKWFRSYFLSYPHLHAKGRAVARRVLAEGGRVVANGGTGCGIADVNWVHYVHSAWPPVGVGNAVRRLVAKCRHNHFARQERDALASAKVIIVNSARTRRDVIDRLNVPDERVHVIYLGVAPDKFHPLADDARDERRRLFDFPRERPLVAFVGALGDRRKGFDTLFAAWQTLCGDANWDAELVVIGSGGELSAWQDRARAARLDGRVHFLGFRHDVPRLMPVFDLLVAPTRYEAYGLGVHEALCCGVPAIVSAQAGVAERFPDGMKRLLLNDHESHEALARIMRDWRRDISIHRRDALELSSELRRYTWDDMAARMVDLIETGHA